ncbi:MAG TPA: ferritin-like domain-containing protein [Anaeromyxobacter sp.]
MQSPELVVELSRLLEMEVDAAQAAAKALAFLPPGPIRDEVLLGAREHEAHVAAIRDHIDYRGYRVPETSSAIRGIRLGASVQPARPDVEDVLQAVRGNAQLACALYGKLLAKGPPEDAQELLERIRGDEARHLRWAERALATRAWEAAGASP